MHLSYRSYITSKVDTVSLD